MLTIKQQDELQQAIKNYNFPIVAFDFQLNQQLSFQNMYSLEKYIFDLLLETDTKSVKNGLSNVLYWGYATSGYRDHRISLFRDKVKDVQLQEAIQLFHQTLKPKITELKALNMPQFSGISFISKIRMFLNPQESAVLDKQIIKMKFSSYGNKTILNKVSHSAKETQIRPSKPNSDAYEDWCQKLLEISIKYYDLKYRAVDIERGLFSLIRQNKLKNATSILANA
jgi:hypothetical protein